MALTSSARRINTAHCSVFKRSGHRFAWRKRVKTRIWSFGSDSIRTESLEYGARRGAIALNTMAVRLLTRWLAPLCLLAAGLTGAAAEEFRTPSITAVRVEWRAVLDRLRTEIASRPPIASRFTFAGQRRVPAWDPRATPALVQLNAINASLFAGIGRSPVPVLLPFDTAGYLDDQADGTQLPLSRYQADFS